MKKVRSKEHRFTSLATCHLAGVTLIELLVSIAVLTLLLAVLLPAVGRARDQVKVVKCASSMREIGHALFTYAGDNGGRLPINVRPWNEVEVMAFSGVAMKVPPLSRGGLSDWMGRVHGELGRNQEPWMAELRCPVVGLTTPSAADPDPTEGGKLPGSCWLLNAYCSARNLSSIPRASEGVLVQEAGVWTRMSLDTPLLSYPQEPWRYPHPSVGFEQGAREWDDWLPARGTRPRRNILWVDGHVDTRLAKTWPVGDLPFDADRIRHMRFGFPGNSPFDP